ncbi:MAG: GGDEF domain-containing protein, partial [Pseudomonadota bacterium]|nr:GGDEF domain-containing protein [Pseudomonadota bacterium]
MIGNADLLNEIDRYLAATPKSLRFGDELEARFQDERAQANQRARYLSSMLGVICFNIGVAALIGSGMVAPGHVYRTFVAALGLIDVPILAAQALAQRSTRVARQNDGVSIADCTFSTFGLIAINNNLDGEIALYQAFSMVMLPVTFNIISNVSFSTALRLAALYMPALLLNTHLNPTFSFAASAFMTFMYVYAAGLSLLANYRIELAERKNYLNYVRENLHNAELSVLSRTDALTGLPNRRDFDARFAAEVERARSASRPLAVIVLDIDHFKLYNDKLGHPEGDKCIRAVARALDEAAGPAPTFAGRIGGEEFALALPGAGVDQAAAAAARARSAVEALRLP